MYLLIAPQDIDAPSTESTEQKKLKKRRVGLEFDGMALKVGDQAPDFEATTHTGEKIRLSDIWEDQPVVLFFYPKSFTPGCTAEACHFRDLESEFSKVGARVFGISSDNQETQRRFVEELGLPFAIVADPGGEILKKYGVNRRLMPFAKRTTFVIDRGGAVLEVIHDEFSMNVHADRALEVLSEGGHQGED